MHQEPISIPLTKPTVEYYGKEARRRTRAARKFISRASVMREVLEQHIAAQTALGASSGK